jgi:phosphohistidine phosphatase
MRTLFLLRHAKSSRDDVGHDDHDRPLAPRGRDAAPMVARRIVETGPVPALVLCSTALRTRETWELVAAVLTPQPAVRFEAGLYLASAAEILTQIRSVPDTVERLMVIGHNDGMQTLARRLAGGGDPEARRRLAQQPFPTAGLAVFDFDQASWRAVTEGGGSLSDVVFPREL